MILELTPGVFIGIVAAEHVPATNHDAARRERTQVRPARCGRHSVGRSQCSDAGRTTADSAATRL